MSVRKMITLSDADNEYLKKHREINLSGLVHKGLEEHRAMRRVVEEEN